MNSGLKVSNTKPTETWNELGIKGEQIPSSSQVLVGFALLTFNPEFIKGFSGFRIAHL
jgi:hypothetical protein